MNALHALQADSRRRGSALVLTLLIVSLLLVMVLAFAVSVRQNLREITIRQQMRLAQANARLGAEMAIATLQEVLGPDQRVTARGDMFDGTNVSMFVPPEFRRLVGVWDSRVHDETNPVAALGGFLGWLVSSGTPGQRLGLNSPLPGAGDPDAQRLVGPASVALAGDHIHARKVSWQQAMGAHNAYAWMVDDHGLKAQLSTAIRNDEQPGRPPGGGVIPGRYPLSRLSGMAPMTGISQEQYPRLNSLREIPLLPDSASPEALPHLAPTRFFDFSTRSMGVLANVRDGGLKKDLTLAFENDTAFSRVFPDSDPARYLLLRADKLALADDLRTNGYIHWNIFRDYYNLKRHIRTVAGKDTIDSVLFNKFNVSENRDGDTATYPISTGTLAPHGMGPATNTVYQKDQPYGHVPVSFSDREVFHNPIGPVLSTLQSTAWLEYEAPAVPGNPAKLTPHFQIWTAHYNPYNIRLDVNGNPHGVRIQNYPQIYVQLPGLPASAQNNRWRASPGNTVVIPGNWDPTTSALASEALEPGNSQVFGIEANFDSLQLRDTNGSYGPNVRDNVSNSVTLGYQNRNYIDPLDPNTVYEVNFTFRFDWANKYQTFVHGANWGTNRMVDG